MTGEQAFIQALKAIATSNAARGLNDDAAVVRIGGASLVLTHDMLVEGVHFLDGTAPADIAWKLVATNMSDLAAKGARPIGVILGYMLRDNDWDAAFAKAFGAALAHYNAPLLGGDSVKAKQMGSARSFGLTALGEAHTKIVPARSGAKAGDNIYLCGTIGDAMLGFEALRDRRAVDPVLAQAYLRPHALLQEGQAIAPIAHAVMDVSDGVLLDAYRMAQASNVTLNLHADDMPISSAAQAILDGLPRAMAAEKRDLMLRWGDDYALLFTADPQVKLPIKAAKIGHVSAFNGAAITLDGHAFDKADQLGYQH